MPMGLLDLENPVYMLKEGHFLVIYDNITLPLLRVTFQTSYKPQFLITDSHTAVFDKPNTHFRLKLSVFKLLSKLKFSLKIGYIDLKNFLQALIFQKFLACLFPAI